MEYNWTLTNIITHNDFMRDNIKVTSWKYHISLRIIHPKNISHKTDR